METTTTLNIQKAKSTKPRIWDFTNPIEFLRAFYDYRKSADESFSYAIWAAEMGIKSRSFLRLLLVEKRNLTEPMAQVITQTLGLNKSETAYLTELMAFHRAGTLKEKEKHSAELTKLRKKFALRKHDVVEIQKKDLFDFLGSYRMPRLQVLLTLKDISKTEDNLAKLLNVKPTEVKEQLKTLQNLQLAKQDITGEWHAQESQLMTPDILGNIALQSFHRKSLEEALTAITLPKDERRFQSLVIPLTAEQFAEVHQELRSKLEEVLTRFESSEGHNKKVYQLNLNIIPVTGSIFRDENHEPTMESTETEKEIPHEKI